MPTFALTMGEDLELTVLMPCLNEAETLGRCVEKALGSLGALGLRGEVLIADNGSTDGSPAIAEKLGARVVHVAEKGYGSALRGGIAAARGRWVIMGDADDSYDFSRLGPFVEKLREGFDLVMGCRMPRGGGRILPGAMPWKHRWIGNPVLSWIGRLFFKCPATDFHCGLRGFSREAYGRMELRTTGMEFASEMVIRATLGNLRIAEVPITLHKDGRSRPPHLRSWRDGWRHLRFMLLFAPGWLFLLPSSLLCTTGFVLGLRLWIGPMQIAGVTFDTNTLLICAMLSLLGVQLGLFAVFSRTFAMVEKLQPESRNLQVWYRVFNLERGLLVGCCLCLAGVFLLVRAVLFWKAAGFGEISYPDSLRQVIPAVTLVVLGLQVVFSSFFLSILGLSKK